ncbi:MAG: RNA methyltransferase [Proteobacteria bacterium]|nr:RNA methyltransferase [Pseudomonadota bacterium]
MFTKVTSDTNQFIKLARSLLEKKSRDKENLFIVEGFKLIDEAVAADFTLKYLYIIEEELQNNIELNLSAQEAFKKTSTNNNVGEIFLISEGLMKKIASTETPPEALAIFFKKSDSLVNSSVEAHLVVANPSPELQRVNLYCENLQDPGNLGGIIRTALASGCENIFLDNCVDIYNPKLIRASAGAVFHVKFHETNLEEFLKSTINLNIQEQPKISSEHLPIQEKITLVATSPRAEHAYYDFKPENHEKIILMMGNEGKGLSEKAFSACDTTLNIPINPKVESLNVLAASTVLLFHFQSLNKRDLYRP